MFARAGVTGRILRGGGEGQGGTLNLHPFLARPKKKTKTRCYCYVPWVWQALVAVLVGLGVLMAGTAMCTLGYYARPLATDHLDNGTHLQAHVNQTSYGHLHNLAYAGPVLMGVGCFVIVVSCVHVCELRDQKIKEFEERRKAKEAARGGKKKKGKNKMYDLIIKQLKKDGKEEVSCAGEQPARASDKHSMDAEAGSSYKSGRSRHRELLKGFLRRCSALSVTSTKSEYSNISVALRKIPMDIFTVDVDGNKDTSLQPIQLTSPKPFGTLVPLTTKYPSDPCLTKSAVKAKRKPLPWLSQPRPPDSLDQIDLDLNVKDRDDEPLLLDDVHVTAGPKVTERSPVNAKKHSSGKSESSSRESSDKQSAIPSSSSCNPDQDSPSNVIVHQASIHYDSEQEKAPAKTNTSSAPGKHELNTSSGGTSCDTKLSASAANPAPKLSKNTTSSCDEDDDGDTDSLFLDEVMLNTFEIATKKSKTPHDGAATTSETKLINLENWEGDKILRDWRLNQAHLARPRAHPASRRATIPNGDCPPLLGPQPHKAKPNKNTRSKSPKKASGAANDAPQKTLRIRTDPQAPELTVRITQVPYSNNLSSTGPGLSGKGSGQRGQGHAAGGGGASGLYKAATSPDLRHNASSGKHRPFCDLHNKPPRAFKR